MKPIKKRLKRKKLVLALGDSVELTVDYPFSPVEKITGTVVGMKSIDLKIVPKPSYNFSMNYLIKITKNAPIASFSFAYKNELEEHWSKQSGIQSYMHKELIIGERYVWTHMCELYLTDIKITQDHLLSVIQDIRNEINSK